MAKEKKLTVNTTNAAGLPAVYSTDVLKVGEVGALVVYTVTKTTVSFVDGVKKSTTGVVTDSVNLRFSTADTPITEDIKRKLTTNVQAFVDAYLGGGTDVATPTVIVGPVGYEWYYDAGMLLAIVKLKIGDVNIAEAHYLGSKPTPTSEPSQLTYSATSGAVPTTLANIVSKNLKAIINKELYGVE